MTAARSNRNSRGMESHVQRISDTPRYSEGRVRGRVEVSWVPCCATARFVSEVEGLAYRTSGGRESNVSDWNNHVGHALVVSPRARICKDS